MESPWSWFTGFFALFFTASLVNLSSPQSTVNSVIEIAKRGELTELQQLCDPQQENDGDTDCLCALSAEYTPHSCDPESPNQITPAFFQGCLSTAQVAGLIKIEGPLAKVPITLDARECGITGETLNLVQRENKWYLLSF